MRYLVHCAALADTEHWSIIAAFADATARVLSGRVDTYMLDRDRQIVWRPGPALRDWSSVLTPCVVVLLAAALAGCTTTWHKPGASARDFQRDSYECRYAGAALPSSAPPPPIIYPQSYANGGGWAGISSQLGALSTQLADRAVQVRMTEDCMVARGWEKE